MHHDRGRQNMGLFSFESKQVKEWKKLAKSGDMEAQYHLARAYANGKGAGQNMKKAVDYCVQAAEQEYAPAQALLAHFYGYGKGVEKNYDEMIHWGEKAALQGYAQAQYNIGRCYEQGKGKEKDFEKAMRWYTLAAEQGRPDAAYKLGQFYEHGLGVEEDMEKAEEWYKKAAEDTWDDTAKEDINVDRTVEEKMEKDLKDFESKRTKNLQNAENKQAEKPKISNGSSAHKNIDNNRKYRCLSEMKVGEAIYLREELLESPFVLTKSENHETELGWGKARAICNTATLVSLTTGKKRTTILYCNNGSMSKEALKSIQSQVDDEYNHEAIIWNEPYPRIPIVLKNVQYTHKHNDMYVMTDIKTHEEYEMIPQSWAVPVLDKLGYNTIVTIAYYEGKWSFVSKKETADIGKYKFDIR